MPRPALTRHWLWHSLLIYLWIANCALSVDVRQDRRALDLRAAPGEVKTLVLHGQGKPSELGPEHIALGAAQSPKAQPVDAKTEPHAENARHIPGNPNELQLTPQVNDAVESTSAPINQHLQNVNPQTEILPSRTSNPVSWTNRIASGNDRGGKVGLQTLIDNEGDSSHATHGSTTSVLMPMPDSSGATEAKKTAETFGISVKALVRKFETLLRMAPNERSIVGGLTSEAKKADYAAQQISTVRHKTHHRAFEAVSAANPGSTGHGFTTDTRILPPLKQGVNHLVLKFLEDFMPPITPAMLQESKTLFKEEHSSAQERKSMPSSAMTVRAMSPSAELLLRRLPSHHRSALPSVPEMSANRLPIVDAKPSPATELPSLQSHVGKLAIDHLLLHPQTSVVPDSHPPTIFVPDHKAGQEQSRKVSDTVPPYILLGDAAHQPIPKEHPLVPYNEPISDLQVSSSASSDIRSASALTSAHLPGEFAQTLKHHAMILISVIEKGKDQPDLYAVALTKMHDETGTHFKLVVVFDDNLQQRFNEAHRAYSMMAVVAKDEHQSAPLATALTPGSTPVVSGFSPEVTIDPTVRQRLNQALYRIFETAKGFSNHAVGSDVNSHLKSNRVALIKGPLSEHGPGPLQTQKMSSVLANLLKSAGHVSDPSERLESHIHDELKQAKTLASHRPIIDNLQTLSDARPRPADPNPDKFLVSRLKRLGHDRGTAASAQGPRTTSPENQNNQKIVNLQSHPLVDLPRQGTTENHLAKLEPSASGKSSSPKNDWQAPMDGPGLHGADATDEKHSTTWPHVNIEAPAQPPVTPSLTRSGTETRANVAAALDKGRANHPSVGPKVAMSHLDQLENPKSRHEGQGQGASPDVLHKAITVKQELQPIKAEEHPIKEGPHPITEPSNPEMHEIPGALQPPSIDDPFAHVPIPDKQQHPPARPFAETEPQAGAMGKRKSTGRLPSSDVPLDIPYYHPGTLASIVSPKEAQAKSGKAGRNLKRLDRFLALWWPRIKKVVTVPLERLQRMLSSAFLIRTSRPPI